MLSVIYVMISALCLCFDSSNISAAEWNVKHLVRYNAVMTRDLGSVRQHISIIQIYSHLLYALSLISWEMLMKVKVPQNTLLFKPWITTKVKTKQNKKSLYSILLSKIFVSLLGRNSSFVFSRGFRGFSHWLYSAAGELQTRTFNSTWSQSAN